MFRRKWEECSEAEKRYLACGVCTPRRVTVSAAYIYQLEEDAARRAADAFTREDAELLTGEIDRLQAAKTEAEQKAKYAERNRRRAEAAAADALAQAAELRTMVRAMRESLAAAQADTRGPATCRADAGILSRFDYLEIGSAPDP